MKDVVSIFVIGAALILTRLNVMKGGLPMVSPGRSKSMCPDCCAFHQSLRWLGYAFTSGEFYLGLGFGVLLLIIFAIFFC